MYVLRQLDCTVICYASNGKTLLLSKAILNKENLVEDLILKVQMKQRTTWIRDTLSAGVFLS